MSVALITANPKFLLLVRRLKLPLPYVRGVMDTLWDTCHANADPVIGTPEEVEAAAQWPGEDGALFRALSTLGWIEPLQGTDKWMVHDYWDHAPHYVHDRLKKRRQREDKKRTREECPGTVPGQAGDNPTLTLALDLALTPLEEKYKETPPIPPSRKRSGERVEYSDAFIAFWATYPKKTGKGEAWKAWQHIKAPAPVNGTIVHAVDLHKNSEAWTKDGGRFIPNPATWINQRRWEDEPFKPKPSTSQAGGDETRANQFRALQAKVGGLS